MRLGIKAPSRIAVHRKEVYDAIKLENEQAAQLKGQTLTSVRPGTKTPRPGRSAETVTRLGHRSNPRKESA